MTQLRAYLASEGFEKDLETELGSVAKSFGRLYLVENGPTHAAWAQNIWLNPTLISVSSIKDASRALRTIQRNWSVYPHAAPGRAKLIQEALPHVSAKAITFPNPKPSAPLGSWTLIDKETLLASSECSSPFPQGVVSFVEDRINPPNRAYLKLWEVLTLIGKYPKKGERCLDLGASPGGWTWVLAELGADVYSIDKAPLDQKLKNYPNIHYEEKSAFSLDPNLMPYTEWLFSDIICYPKRLYDYIGRWLSSGKVRNFVCTIKFQGETDHAVAALFSQIPGSRLIHLYHNKHELTWYLIQDLESPSPSPKR